MIKYAPIIIPTLNRYTHLVKCIESLQNNTYAKYTDLFIAVDFPPDEKYKEGYGKVIKYLSKNIQGFHSVELIYREKNYGAIVNGFELANSVLKSYDRIILLEDDNELSPNFIEFCDKALEYFENDKSIIAINASNYVWSGEGRRTEFPDDGNNVKKRQLLFHAMATWREDWNEIQQWCDSGQIIQDGYKFKQMKKLYKKSKCFFNSFLDNVLWSHRQLPWINGKIYAIDQVWDYFMLLNDKYVIYPNEGMTRDLGCDGSGVNYKTKYDNMQEIINLPMYEGISFDIEIKKDLAVNEYEIYLHDKNNYRGVKAGIKTLLHIIDCIKNKKYNIEKTRNDE